MHLVAKRLILCLLFLGMILSGCVPTGQGFSPLNNLSSNDSAVYVYRPYNMIGGGKLYSIFIDSQEVGKLVNGAYQPFMLPAGLHHIELKQDAFLIKGATFNINTKLAAGRSYYLRFGVQWVGSKAQFMPVDKVTAQPELVKCKKY